METNQFSQSYNFRALMKSSLPPMVMLVFMSLYQTMDGVFVSNFIGELGLTALNIVYPFTSVVIAVSIMLATGASAVVARNMGQGKAQEAKENFTLVIVTGLVLSLVITLLGAWYIEDIIWFLGATPRIYEMCYDYLIVIIWSTPLAVLQLLFQTFFVTAAKPKLGLAFTVLGGAANIILDYLFLVVFPMGIQGAAVATAVGYSFLALFGLYYFTFHRRGQLYFVKPKLRWRVLGGACLNGLSEMINNLAVAVTTLIFNLVGIRYLREEGIAAIAIVLYAQFIMTSVFMGYASGVAPIFSYKYGAEDHAQIRKLFRISILFVGSLSVVTFLAAFPLAKPIGMVFAADNPYVLNLAVRGFWIFAVSFLFTGLNIFASALFTAFSNGAVSGLLSFLRTFVLLSLALVALPPIIGADGIWLAVPVAEGAALIVSVFYLVKYRKVYRYGRE